MNTRYIIGITGGSASGKTQFLNSLLQSFKPKDVCLISQDNYYRPRNEQLVDENGVFNFDRPESIDFEAYARDISQLKSGEEVHRQEYTFNNSKVTPKQLVFKPSPIIVVEGIFVFYIKEIANMLDLKIFIDAKDHIMLKRRIIRDDKERGYDLDDVLYRYESHVMPTYEKYILPFKADADLIVPNNTEFTNAKNVLVAYMNTKLSK